MSKQILPNELAELVCGLLVKPALFGELDTPHKHQAFMLDIGRVVADHCGGHINGLNGPDWEEGYLRDEPSSPMLSVSPNDSLPNLHNCIWSYFDPTGWEKETENDSGDTEATDAISAESVCEIRVALQNLLCAKPYDHHALEMLENNTRILSDLLNDIVLDFDVLAKDCLEVFDEYEWVMCSGSDAVNFERLKDKGCAGQMGVQELRKFLGMVSPEGETHICYSVQQAELAVARYKKCAQSSGEFLTPETYSVVAMSTGHLTEADRVALATAPDSGDQMILNRDTGFFVKLYEEESSNYRTEISETLKDIICWAHRSGYRMVEFDCDAPALSQFPVFER